MSLFGPRDEADLLQLIREYPLAWVVSGDAGDLSATPLPLLAETDENGRLVALLGHFARANPQVAALAHQPQATILFLGPQGYVSPQLLADRDWAPTWNFAVARFAVRVEFVPAESESALAALVDTMEHAHPSPWTMAELGTRKDTLVPKIIAFRAHIQASRSTFKLGQDERPDVLADIIAGHEDHALTRWMTAFATDRS